MKLYILETVLMALLSRAGHAEGGCTIANIQTSANDCLTSNNVPMGTEFLIPVLQDAGDIENFCTVSMANIKQCITNVVATCVSDRKVRILFGSMGRALLAAYNGICQDAMKKNGSLLTCAYKHHAHSIHAAIHTMVEATDSKDSQTSSFSDICHPISAMHTQVLKEFDEAVTADHCTKESRDAMEIYLTTIVFPCNNDATAYYPCTARKVNQDAINCYAQSGVNIKNAVVPTPGSLSEADEFCSSRGVVLKCIKTLLLRCLYEPQVTAMFGSSAAEYEAGIECMCKLKNADMTLTCASNADVTTAWTTFYTSIHNHSISGNLDKEMPCSLQRKMLTDIRTSMNHACADPAMRAHWTMFMHTVGYPCNPVQTSCYPRHKNNGAETIQGKILLLTLLLSFMAAFQRLVQIDGPIY